MKLNRIQIHIFQKMSDEHSMGLEEYLLNFSKENINRRISALEELAEDEADTWITRSYLESLG